MCERSVAVKSYQLGKEGKEEEKAKRQRMVFFSVEQSSYMPCGLGKKRKTKKDRKGTQIFS